MLYGLGKSSNYGDLRRINFKVFCRLQSFSNGMFCSCRICIDKRVAWSLCNSRASCLAALILHSGDWLKDMHTSCGLIPDQETVITGVRLQLGLSIYRYRIVFVSYIILFQLQKSNRHYIRSIFTNHLDQTLYPIGS